MDYELQQALEGSSAQMEEIERLRYALDTTVARLGSALSDAEAEAERLREVLADVAEGIGLELAETGGGTMRYVVPPRLIGEHGEALMSVSQIINEQLEC